MLIKGACHCANISFELDWPGEGGTIPVRACSCSFCTKHGGTYTSHREARLHVKIADRSLVSEYRFGTRTADFLVCSRCGAIPVITSEIDDHLYAVVNVNTFEGIDRSKLQRQVTDFDGENTESRLERRSRTWIPLVKVETPDA
jgi:hypothetical protein